jgi:hypothetical protein
MRRAHLRLSASPAGVKLLPDGRFSSRGEATPKRIVAMQLSTI